MKQKTITIQIPSDLLEQAQSLEDESGTIEDLVTIALTKEIQERINQKAHRTILKLREKIKQRTGNHPDPVPLIRQLRQGEAE